jgi:hypothetical protein
MENRVIYLAEFFRVTNWFLWLGLTWFLFFTVYARHIYSKPPEGHWSRRLHLYSLHGFGALTGWIAFGYLWVVDWKEPRWEYLVVAAVSFLGITGTLPWATFFNKWFRQN